MHFASLNFLLFVPSISILYWLTPSKFRWITLLIASYFFYINIKPVFVLLLVGVTLSTYIFTRLIDGSHDEIRKRLYMRVNIVLILLPLGFFKYFAEVNNAILLLMESMHLRWVLPEISLLLPIGISFYTFMAIGYTVDVYNEEIKAEKNIGIVALFVSFFPLILSGPIERAKNMFPQFNAQKKLDLQMVVKGMKLMLWGYFMKLVVADRLSLYVDTVHGNSIYQNGPSFLLASILYPFQIYADLGGYTLIVVGTASILGFNVIQNFNRPFFATSMSEFWRRWHISLISWLTDYVYTPMSFALRKFRIWGIVISLMVTFILSGLWHGASLTFVAWGVMQGVFLSIEALLNKRKILFERKHHLRENFWYIFLGICITFILFATSQVFARANSLNDAVMIYRKIFLMEGSLYLHLDTLALSLFGLLVLFSKDFKDEFFPNRISFFSNSRIIVRWASYLFILFSIIILGVFEFRPFIYFQF